MPSEGRALLPDSFLGPPAGLCTMHILYTNVLLHLFCEDDAVSSRQGWEQAVAGLSGGPSQSSHPDPGTVRGPLARRPSCAPLAPPRWAPPLSPHAGNYRTSLSISWVSTHLFWDLKYGELQTSRGMLRGSAIPRSPGTSGPLGSEGEVSTGVEMSWRPLTTLTGCCPPRGQLPSPTGPAPLPYRAGSLPQGWLPHPSHARAVST